MYHLTLTDALQEHEAILTGPFGSLLHSSDYVKKRRNVELITWRYRHDDRQYHLKKIQLQQNPTIPITSTWAISISHEFNISIMDFVRDIKDSTNRPNGYLDSLEKTPHLQDRFEMAIIQIYSS